MFRYISALLFGTIVLTAGRAQDIVPVGHRLHRHATPVFEEGNSCATSNCATGVCNDCMRIDDIKKTQVPVYSCKIKEICISNRSIFGHLFGCSGDCKKIEVPQLIKKYRTDEVCITRCVTGEEAAKHYEAEAKKAAAKAKEQMPAPLPVPGKLPVGAAGAEFDPSAPVSPQWSLIPAGIFEFRKN